MDVCRRTSTSRRCSVLFWVDSTIPACFMKRTENLLASDLCVSHFCRVVSDVGDVGDVVGWWGVRRAGRSLPDVFFLGIDVLSEPLCAPPSRADIERV